MRCIPIPASCGAVPFEGQNHKMSTCRQWRSYELINLDTCGLPLVIPIGAYTHTCSLWIRSFQGMLWIWSFEGQHDMTSTWYPCISYKLVKIYTCRRPLIVPSGRVYWYLLAVDPVLSKGNIAWNRPNNSAPRTTRGGGLLVPLRPSLCPSVRPASRVRSLAPTVLVGSFSYLYILSSNFRWCVKFLAKFEILIFGIF